VEVKREIMSYSLSTLLLRNLSDVFGENDPERRRAAIDEIFHEDAVFYDPKSGVFRGRDEIARIAGVIKATRPDFKYQPLSPPEESGDAGRVRWVSGTPGKPPAYAGTDFIVVRNGRIAAVYLFSTAYPELSGQRTSDRLATAPSSGPRLGGDNPDLAYRGLPIGAN
jgi:hypothetical protein